MSTFTNLAGYYGYRYITWSIHIDVVVSLLITPEDRASDVPYGSSWGNKDENGVNIFHHGYHGSGMWNLFILIVGVNE